MALTAQPRAGRPRRRWIRTGVRVLVVLLGALGVLLLAVHLPFVRTRTLAWAAGELARQGIRLEAGGLHYNALALTADLERVRLTATGSGEPFLEADALRINLPASVLGGALHIQSIDIDRPRLQIVRHADGSWNLPRPASKASEPLRGPLEIDHLLVKDLTLEYRDDAGNMEVSSRGLTLAMDRRAGTPLTGRLAVSEPVSVRRGTRNTKITTFEARLSFDGQTLSVDALDAAAAEGRARIAGTVGLLGAAPRLNLTGDVTLDVERLADWFETGFAERPRGRLVAHGRVEGAFDSPRIAIRTTSEELTWPAIGALSLDTVATVGDGIAAVESARIGVGSGELVGAGRVSVTGAGPSETHVRWRNLDVGTVSRGFAGLPVRPAAFADGELSLFWTDADFARARGRLISTLRDRAAATNTLPLSGRVEMTLDNQRWNVAADSRVAGGLVVSGSASGRLVTPLSSSTLAGQVVLRAADLADALRGFAAAGLDGGASGVVRGTAAATIDLGGTIGAPLAAGRASAEGLWIAGTGPASAAARFRTTSAAVTIDDFRLSDGPNAITGTGALTFRTRAITGELRGDITRLTTLVNGVPELWRPEGSAQAVGRLAGTLDKPTIDVDVSSSALRVAGQPIQSLRSTLRFANRIVTMSALELAQSEGRLSASGSYALDGGRYTVTATGTNLSIDPDTTWPVRARFDLRVDGSGTIDRPQAIGTIGFTHLDWGEYALDNARATATWSGDRLEIQSVLPSLGGRLDATMDLRDRTVSATASAVDANLSALIHGSADTNRGTSGPVTLAGTTSFRAAAKGALNDLAALDVAIDLDAVDATLNGVPIKLDRPAQIRRETGQIIAGDLGLRVGTSTISARGRLGAGGPADDRLRIQLIGSLADLVPFARLPPGSGTFAASGAVDLQVQATGPIETPDVTGRLTLTDAAVTANDLPPVTAIGVTSTYAAGRVNVAQLSATWQGAQLSGTAEIPIGLLKDVLPSSYVDSLPGASGPAQATVRLSSVTPEVVAPFVESGSLDRINGRIDLAATLEASKLDVSGVTADVTLDRAEVELAHIPIAQATPTRLRLNNGRLDVVSWHWTGSGNDLEVTGSMRVADDMPSLNVAVKGAIDLRIVGGVVPDTAVTGRATVDVRASGPVNALAVDGDVVVSDAELALRNPRLAISDLKGTATFSRNHLQLRDVTASANGGDLRVEGGIDYDGLAMREGALTLAGRGMAFELVDGLRTDIDADLTLGMTGGEPALGGQIRIARGDYRRRLRLIDLLGTSRTAAPPGRPQPGGLGALKLDIAITSDDDVIVDNNYGRLEVGTQLTLVGTAAAPALAGRLAVNEGGRVFLGGRTYAVRRATIAFSNPTFIEPRLDVALETRVQQDDITLEVTGTPDALEVGVRAPGLSQQDAISMLLTGQPADATSAGYSEIARGQLLMLLSGEILGAAGQAVGLDSVSVGHGLGAAASTFDLLITESDPDARLTIAKNLRRDVELVVSQNLSATGGITWILAYRPVRRLEFRAATNDDDSQTYEFRHEIPFGGPPAVKAAGRTASLPAVRVAGIEIQGAPGPLAADLRRELHLGAGARFDFYKWQQDRDRLALRLRERGFLEARVGARRPAAGESSVTLQYDVATGPHTTLVVEGFAMPARAIAEMKDAWSNATFDGFLREDLTRVARRALVSEGHLTAEVTVSLSDPGADEKTAVVRIVPGQRFDQRRLAFEGNREVTTATLAETARASNLDVEAWLDRESVRTAIEDFYRSAGYLSASVMVDPPVFEHPAARLPVRIDEGPLYRIGTVSIDGSAPRSDGDVRSLFGLTEGAAYKPDTIEPARRKVEAEYLRNGFSQVRVRADVLADKASARVDVSLAIVAGPQQVLEAVGVTGADVTSPGTIDWALQLPVGKPVGLSDLFNAQKRLYDTGVFQSVDVTVEPASTVDVTSGSLPVRATVTVRELPRYRLRYGFRVLDPAEPEAGVRQLQPGFVADLMDRNLFGRAITAGVAGQIEANRTIGRVIVSMPSLLRRSVITNVFVTQSREEIAPEAETPFVDRGFELTVEQRVRPARKMSVTYGLSFDRKHVYEPDPDPSSLFPPLDLRTNIARLTSAYAWDTRDDPSNATRGWFHSSGLEYGVEALGSDLRFIRYLAQQFYMHRAGRRVVLASAFRLGAAHGFEQELIRSERFFAGGGTSVRGFGQDALGGLDVLGAPTGGNGLIVFNQEARIRAHRWVGGVVFFDAGNVFPLASEMSFKKLEAGTGVGLRVISPFAILRVDYGVPLTGRSVLSTGRWYFGIGHTF